LILPAPPRTYRDAVVLPSPLPPSPSDTYDTTTVPKSRRRRKNTPRDAPHASQPHTQSLLANCALSAPPPTSATPLATNFCFHGTAINPDNGKIAGYRELLTCSTAPLWATANGLEIGRLFQGLGPHSDMPTVLIAVFSFISMKCPHTNAPLTSALCVPIALKKPFPNAFVGLLGVIVSFTLAMSAPRLLISLLQNVCSTAPSVPPVAAS